jgi:hypothetical protein
MDTKDGGMTWEMPPPVDYSKMSSGELRQQIRRINDRLVDKGAPRPLISPTVTGMEELDEEAKDLHSNYFAIRYVLESRGDV